MSTVTEQNIRFSNEAEQANREIQNAYRNLEAAKVLQQLADSYCNIIKLYHKYSTDDCTMCDLCLNWLEYYWDNFDEHDYIHKSYPDKDRLKVDGIICDTSDYVMKNGTEQLKKRLRRFHADRDLWWYNGEFTQELPDDYDFKI